MEQISNLLSGYTLPTPKKRRTERGDFLERFSKKTGKPIGYIAFRLTGIPTSDLYILEKNCDNYKGAWSKAFFGQLKPRTEDK